MSALLSPAPQPEQLQWWTLDFRHLLRIEEAALLLDDLHKRSVVALCEEGKLRGVNIAAATDTRRELRIYRYSVEWLGRSERSGRAGPAHPPPEAILSSAFGTMRPNFRPQEVAEFLGCTERHVRLLSMLTGPQFSERQNRIIRPALIAFLQAREIQ